MTRGDIFAAIAASACRYEAKASGLSVRGAPVSELPALLRNAGWRNVSKLDADDLRALGLTVLTARYVNGSRPGRWCAVIVSAGEAS